MEVGKSWSLQVQYFGSIMVFWYISTTVQRFNGSVLSGSFEVLWVKKNNRPLNITNDYDLIIVEWTITGFLLLIKLK